MKNLTARILSLIFPLILIVSLVSCDKSAPVDALWENAVYQTDTEFGVGEKTIKLEVKAGEKSVTFTVKTDEAILGTALLEHGIIAGEESVYGLYIKTVNGITADYDVDQSYWGFCKDGEYMMSGVDTTEFADGEHYELVYTK